MGNSFGYFASQNDDSKVLKAAARVLKSTGTLLLDLTNGGLVLVEEFVDRLDDRGHGLMPLLCVVAC